MFTPKIILVSAFVLMLASSALSFLNKGRLAAKNDEITQSKSVASVAQADAARARTDQQKAKKTADDAVAKTAELQTQLATATSQVGDLNGKFTEANNTLNAKNTEVADLTKKLADAQAAPKAAEATPEMTAKLEAVTRERDELKVVKDGLDAQVRTAQTRAAALEQQIAARARGALMQGLRGRVLAVDRNWNFVVLDLGNRNGVNNNATMIIQRGGSMVGRVRITSVEPSQSVADIIPNSVPEGVTVQPGDVVVYSGS